MSALFPSASDQGIVVFWLWKSLHYGTRMALSFALIIAGCVLQYLGGTVVPGVVLLALGNLLLLVRGYDNRVTAGKYDPATTWQRVEYAKVLELDALSRKMRAWDRSALDITNPLGALVLIAVLGVLGAALWLSASVLDSPLQIAVIDAAVLVLPHYVTGIRSILTKPNLMIKITFIEKLFEVMKPALAPDAQEFFMLLKDAGVKLPDDVKFRVPIAGQQADFLGLYGQIVTNTVQGTSYPYFYTVLVAKKGYGLERACQRYKPPENITNEFKQQGDVEVFVIRQTTTQTSGYCTTPADGARILGEALKLAAWSAVKH